MRSGRTTLLTACADLAAAMRRRSIMAERGHYGVETF